MSLAVSGGVFVLMVSLARRITNRSQADTRGYVDGFAERLERLEQQLLQNEELDGRVDFLERVVMELRDGQATFKGLPRKDKTPA
jgi:hypothetical protein